MTLQQRFEQLYIPVPEAGCWLWLGTIKAKGYGGFTVVKGESQRAHRVSWIITHGKIPEGMCVLHKCDTRSCVNPDHLFLGTNDDNVKDRGKKDRTARGNRNGNFKM